MDISAPSLFVFSIVLFSHLQSHCFAVKQSYIVYMGETKRAFGPKSMMRHMEDVLASHLDFLTSILPGVENIKNELLYSYSSIFDGFAVTLDEEQAESIANHPNVSLVLKNHRRKLDTTYSWNFLGVETKANSANIIKNVNLRDPIAGFGGWASKLFGDNSNTNQSLWEKAKYGEDIIIGSLDSGAWPESPSFNDDGFSIVPTRWQGQCDIRGNMHCNRKLIGARLFYKGYEAEASKLDPSLLTARDYQGHGTHTLSTAGGSYVSNFNLFGLNNQTATGGAPRARVAIYKVCWPSQNDSGGCFDADILAAYDAAIADGVDVISMSLGGSGVEMYMDATALGSYHATQKGIIVVTSAGNDGPRSSTVKNVAPWVITVGASTINRDFSTYITLGDNTIIKGTSLSDKSLPPGKFYPLIRGANTRTNGATTVDSDMCMPGTLDTKKVEGKILVCLRGQLSRVQKGFQAALAGAVGMIMVNDEQNGNQTLSEPHVLPASHISSVYGQIVYNYMSSTRNATATISPVKIKVGTEPAPVMAVFSSRGPNPFEHAILKPDITAPGVNIIAAYPQSLSPTELEYDSRRVGFNVMSGTSMSCPHIAGIVALLKAVHKDWSPSAIRSALMTTATTHNNINMPILEVDGTIATPFDFGAGHVQPNLAADPGLIYDISLQDYTDFLCARGFYAYMTREKGKHPPLSPCHREFSVVNFNYPSITVPNINFLTTITRKLTNVGTPGTYHVDVKAPPGILVTVSPMTLTFEQVGEIKTYTVNLRPEVRGYPKKFVFGQLTWSDGKHNVSSPLVVKHA